MSRLSFKKTLLIAAGILSLMAQGILLLPKSLDFLLRSFTSLGQLSHWSGVFCAFMFCLLSSSADSLQKNALEWRANGILLLTQIFDCDRNLSLIGWLRSTRTRGWIPFKQPCHHPDDLRHLYPYNSIRKPLVLNLLRKKKSFHQTSCLTPIQM